MPSCLQRQWVGNIALSVARRSGLAISHVRYYERAGLLPAPLRNGGRVRYPVSVLRRLETIAGAREAGLSLDEIRELTALGARLGQRAFRSA